MEENQNEEEVLFVADKNDDGKLKAVDKSAAKEGIWRLLLPSMENLDDFLKVGKQSSILEDFFSISGISSSSPPTFLSTVFPPPCWIRWTCSPTCSGIPKKTRISSTCTRLIRMIIRYWHRSRNLPPKRSSRHNRWALRAAWIGNSSPVWVSRAGRWNRAATCQPFSPVISPVWSPSPPR